MHIRYGCSIETMYSRSALALIATFILLHIINGGLETFQSESSNDDINANTLYSRIFKRAQSIGNDYSSTKDPIQFPPPLSPDGIAVQVTVEDVTDNSATVFWENSEHYEGPNYRMVGYEVDPDTYLVKRKVEDVFVDGDVPFATSSGSGRPQQ